MEFDLKVEHVPFHLLGLLREVEQSVEKSAKRRRIFVHLEGLERLEHVELIGSPEYLREMLKEIVRQNIAEAIPGDRVIIHVKETECRHLDVDAIEGMDVGLPILAGFHFEVERRGVDLRWIAKCVETLHGTMDEGDPLRFGKTFGINLTMEVNQADEGRAESMSTMLQRVNFSGKTALVVDDNAMDLRMLAHMLESIGFQVFLANNGQEAVEQYQSSANGQIAVIFMDIIMPVLGGVDAAKAIRRLPRVDAMRVPIIAVTANLFGEDAELAQRAGMNEHLEKPLNKEKLVQTLVRWM